MAHYNEFYELYKCQECKRKDLNYDDIDFYIYGWEVKKHPILKKYDENSNLHICKRCKDLIMNNAEEELIGVYSSNSLIEMVTTVRQALRVDYEHGWRHNNIQLDIFYKGKLLRRLSDDCEFDEETVHLQEQIDNTIIKEIRGVINSEN